MGISAIQIKIRDIGMWTFILGNTFHKMDSQKALSSGVGVGRFHQALSDLDYDFKAPPRGGHNTPEKNDKSASCYSKWQRS